MKILDNDYKLSNSTLEYELRLYSHNSNDFELEFHDKMLYLKTEKEF